MTMKTNLNLETGIKLPPPIIYLAALIIGMVIDDFWPLSLFPEIWGHIIGSVFILVSILLVPTFLIQFKKAGTTFDVRKSATTLITDGPYRYLRHPMYTSGVLYLVGCGLFSNNWWMLLLPPSTFLLLVVCRLTDEEEMLSIHFAEAWEAYKSKTYAFLPFIW